MKKGFYLLLLIPVFLWASCSLVSQEKELIRQREIKINDKNIKSKDGEVIIDGTTFEANELPTITSRKSSKEESKTAADGSQINTMFDGFGNKTEIRAFPDNLLVQCIISRTFADGRKQIFVYGQNGEVKILPEDMSDRVLSSSGNDLARSAGIFTGRKPRTVPTPLQNTELPPTTVPTQQSEIEKSLSPDAPLVSKENKISTEKKKTTEKSISIDVQKLELQAKKRQPKDQQKN
jgi:hypothetical protein